jgi:hypothetical protein
MPVSSTSADKRLDRTPRELRRLQVCFHHPPSELAHVFNLFLTWPGV